MSNETGTESFAITPADGVAIQRVRALWIGGAGDVTLRHTAGGQTALFAAIPAGTLLPVCAVEVLAAGTSASLIRGIL